MDTTFARWDSVVRYAECDAQGVVFNAHYLTYFDCTVNEAFRNTGVDWLQQMQSSGCDVQLVKSVVEYHKPLRFDEAFFGQASVARLGRSSVTWQLHIFGDSTADLRASGEIVWVYANLKEQRSEPLPNWMRKALAPLCLEPETD
nr:acyl-CoA thioesterase [Oceanococcus sp. HetDA_MAG_MS8]